MKMLKIKAVLLTDGKDYIIHGTNNEDATTMFKRITHGDSPPWFFNPATDDAHYIEIGISVPEYEDKVVTEEIASEPEQDNRMDLTLDDLKNTG